MMEPIDWRRRRSNWPGKKAGLTPGDEILKVDGSDVENFMDIQNRIVTKGGPHREVVSSILQY